MKHTLTLLMICLFANFSFATVMGPWDLDELFKAPKWEKTDTAAKPGMTGILYSSIPLNGNPVQVFAYYSTPKGAPPKGGWPAVVCVHGGGGTAFDQWVQLWNDHGYAAISMDLEGHYPIKLPKERSSKRRSTENPGPSRVGVFSDFEKPIDQQWYYHAVAQVVLAHSLIRSFPEVNADKIGITGISWGGTLTSTTMGVDNRFKFAIPVYGCGFLPDSDGHQGNTIKPGKHTEVVNAYFDGSAYFKNVTIPTLWVNGTNDEHFTMPTTQKSSQTVQGPATIRFELEMPHGHGPGWHRKEIYAFADSIVKDGMSLVQFGKPQVDGDQATVTYTSSTKVTKAELLYTLDTTAWLKRKWQKIPAVISGSTLKANVPSGATAFFFSATDERKLMTTSELNQASATQGGTTGQLNPIKLTTEYLSNPVGLQTDKPAFSWQFEIEIRDQRQTAYRVLVASNLTDLNTNRGDLWDSDKVESDRSVNVLYEGTPLQSRQVYYWKVQIWDANGEASGWTKPASFEIAFLKENDWNAKWIGQKPTDEKHLKLSPLLRKEFTAEKSVKKARAYFSGLGFSELYLNGKKVSDNVLSPIMTDYLHEVNYKVFDVTSFLKDGGNAIGIWLGNGWYSGPIQHYKEVYGDTPRALFQLELELTDGTRMVIYSDETWKTSDSPISLNTLVHGEHYDARLEQPGWNQINFNDSSWKQVDILSAPWEQVDVPTAEGNLVSQMCPGMKVMERVKPIKITNPKEGVWVFHFDKFYVGWAQLRARGEAGQTVELEYGPALLPDGTVKNIWKALRGEDETDRYTFKGDPDGETYEPRFTIHPMWYVQVTGLIEKPDENTITGCNIYNDYPMEPEFHCSNDMFNDIHAICQQSAKNALKGFIQDTPHRELYGYNEPGSVSATFSGQYHMPRFWIKFAWDCFLADKSYGYPIDIAPLPAYFNLNPKGRVERKTPDLGQATNYLMMLWNMYQRYDDPRVIESHYPAITRWIETIGTMSDDEHVVTDGWLGEHMLPGDKPGQEQYISLETGRPHIWTTLACRTVELATQMADLLGKKEDANKYRELAKAIRKTVNEKFYNQEKASYDTGSQTANILPLALGLVPEKEIPRVVETIKKTIEANNGKMRVGHLGLSSLMETATQFGFGETLFNIVNRTDYPGWGFMLESGATTVWEAWGVHDFKVFPATESMTHLSSVERFFFDDVAGIRTPDFFGARPFTPGYKNITIAPQVLGDLTEASATIETVRGTIRSSWSLSEKKFSLNVTIPPNATAEVLIPCLDWKNVMLKEGGQTINIDGSPIGLFGVHSAKRIGNVIRCKVGSGRYRFMSACTTAE